MAPSFLIHQVTVRCNSRCAMCGIWKLEPGDELKLEEVDSLLGDPFMAGLRWVNLTGGEPFLRQDLPELIGAYGRRCPELEIVAIPTNGFLPDRIEEGVKRALQALEGTGALLSVTVSFGGWGFLARDADAEYRAGGHQGLAPQRQRTLLRERLQQTNADHGKGGTGEAQRLHRAQPPIGRAGGEDLDQRESELAALRL
jgi:hypothetical protein